ncbi:MAG: F-box protein [Verrucomicrobia bacterium]|nr:F-box protein [Verrucomicrobiota bacterium]
MSTPTQRISHPLDFSCLINQPIQVHALQEALAVEDDEMKPESHSLFAQVVLIEIIYKHIFSSLDIGSLARLGTVCKEFRILGNGYVLCLLKSYSLMKIVDNYGFEPASDLRNLVIVQKAYEACLSEGLEEDLSFSTLPKKIAVAEDRNLIKLFLRYMNTIFAGRIVTYLKNNPEEAEFLRQHPELNVCCISQVEDIPGAANTIRAWLNNRQPIQMNVLYLGKLPSTHNVHMCIVPPEILHFRLNILLANKNAFTLISRNVGAAIQGTVDLRYNQLGALPDELGSVNTQSAYATEGNPNDMLPPKGSPRTKLINRSDLTFHALGAKLQMVMLPEAVKLSEGKSCGS